jgi:hypothetical protein
MQTQTTAGPEPELTAAAQRLLHRVVAQHEHRAFPGNAGCWEILVQGGYIEIVHRQGAWYRLRPTPKGFATAL